MLSAEEVKHIALLARIGLTEEETERYRTELSSVLDFFADLKQVQTDGVEPIGHITGRSGEGRADSAENLSESERAVLLANAPEMHDNYIKVRSVF